MQAWNILSDLLMLLTVALVLGGVCERLRQSAIIGYLFAGVLLGPNALGVFGSGSEVELLAELGVALLLFSIGLEVSWARLRACGRASLVGGAVQVIVTTIVGAGIATAFGLDGRAAVVVGAALALSSTASVLRLLQSRSELDSGHGRITLGILLVQDVAVVPLVLIVSTIRSEGTLGDVALGLARGFGVTVLMLAAFFVLFAKVIPRVLDLTSTIRNRELPVLLAIVTGIGSALLAHELGISPSIGAFVAGVLLAGSPYSVFVRADVSALRTVFMTLFFSSVGMLADPAWALGNSLPMLGTLVLVIAVKAGLLFGILRTFGVTSPRALATGLALGQSGEFALVLVGAGRDMISDDVFQLLTSATILTLLLTPTLVHAASRAAAGQRRSDPQAAGGAVREGHVVVIGFGPAGQAVAETLGENGLTVEVVDLNHKLLEEARARGLPTTLGDATHPDVLEHACVATARLVAVTLPDDRVAAPIVRQVRGFASGVPVIARGRYHMHLDRLTTAGASVVDEEWTVGEELGRRALELVGEA